MAQIKEIDLDNFSPSSGSVNRANLRTEIWDSDLSTWPCLGLPLEAYYAFVEEEVSHEK